MREEESPEEGPSKRVRGGWVQRLQDGGSEGGAELALLLEGIKSALEEQTWLMRQMWLTHAAMESELQLLRQGMEYVFDQVIWIVEGEQKRAREHGVPKEAREGDETME